ncbi:MAG: hypothetical protein KDI50_03770 [Candidatus Competibacteraceae bacterium]|nr:hypothetical protein [Candidatus Competibacteraceae bacterium]
MKAYLINLKSPEKGYPLSYYIKETTHERAEMEARKRAVREHGIKEPKLITLHSIFEELKLPLECEQ